MNQSRQVETVELGMLLVVCITDNRLATCLDQASFQDRIYYTETYSKTLASHIILSLLFLFFVVVVETISHSDADGPVKESCSPNC